MTGTASSGEFPPLPPTLRAERHSAVAVLTLNRPEKRNAFDDTTMLGIEAFFSAIPDGIRAAVLHGAGGNFSAGLDLAELTERDVVAGIEHSRFWHRVFDKVELGKVPVVAVLHGAVVGGGLELAAACHVRVAEVSAFYALPETSRGIFVGGGGSVRLPPLIGTSRMMEMMLTGRTLTAEEGQAIGLTHYLVGNGAGFAKGLELAEKIAGNAPFTNYAVMHVLPRIASSDPATGFAAEALTAAIAQGEDEAKARLQAFLERRGPKVVRS
jgi:(methylthio)acryloyl-CoA hydratase